MEKMIYHAFTTPTFPWDSTVQSEPKPSRGLYCKTLQPVRHKTEGRESGPGTSLGQCLGREAGSRNPGYCQIAEKVLDGLKGAQPQDSLFPTKRRPGRECHTSVE